MGKIRDELALEPTGRPAKSTTSIAEKLRRETIRLTQIQDIAGCRLIVQEIVDQDTVVKSFGRLFERVAIVDRRQKPSHGYRAVHVIVLVGDKAVEIQVRTSLQHLWAELSEKLSDVVDPAIKYGGGDQKFQALLMEQSGLVADEESFELKLADDQARLSALLAQGRLSDDEQREILNKKELTEAAQKRVLLLRERVYKMLRRAIDNLPVRR